MRVLLSTLLVLALAVAGCSKDEEKKDEKEGVIKTSFDCSTSCSGMMLKCIAETANIGKKNWCRDQATKCAEECGQAVTIVVPKALGVAKEAVKAGAAATAPHIKKGLTKVKDAVVEGAKKVKDGVVDGAKKAAGATVEGAKAAKDAAVKGAGTVKDAVGKAADKAKDLLKKIPIPSF
jgi:hypothetical protein